MKNCTLRRVVVLMVGCGWVCYVTTGLIMNVGLCKWYARHCTTIRWFLLLLLSLIEKKELTSAFVC